MTTLGPILAAGLLAVIITLAMLALAMGYREYRIARRREKLGRPWRKY